MSRLNAEQAATFPNGGGRTSFLSLQNDGDSAVVRFAYESPNDIPRHLIHEVDGADGKRKQLGCLRVDFSEPESVCPLCASGLLPKKSIYFNVRNEETGEMQIWQRGEGYYNMNMETMFKEYVAGGTPLCSIPFKIIRKGAKGDTQTKYTFIALPADKMKLEEFPDDIIVEEEGIVKDYSFEELDAYLATGVLPGNNQNEQPAAIRPRGQVASAPAPIQADPVQAPVNTGRRTIRNNIGGY